MCISRVGRYATSLRHSAGRYRTDHVQHQASSELANSHEFNSLSDATCIGYQNDLPAIGGLLDGEMS